MEENARDEIIGLVQDGAVDPEYMLLSLLKWISLPDCEKFAEDWKRDHSWDESEE